jgi:hypothetical protein
MTADIATYITREKSCIVEFMSKKTIMSLIKEPSLTLTFRKQDHVKAFSLV